MRGIAPARPRWEKERPRRDLNPTCPANSLRIYGGSTPTKCAFRPQIVRRRTIVLLGLGVGIGLAAGRFFQADPGLADVTQTLGSGLTDCRSALDAVGVIQAKIGPRDTWDLTVRTLAAPGPVPKGALVVRGQR